MACRKYEGELRKLAAGDLAPHREREVRAHLPGCAPCRQVVEAEKRLFAAVDAALREEMNAEVPVSLAAQIRSAAVEQLPSRRMTWWRWAAAGAAVVATLVMAVMLRRTDTPSVPQNKPDRPAVAGGSKSTLSAAAPATPRRGDRKPVAGHGERSESRGRPALPEVLVPAEERVAFARFAESLRAGRDTARGVLSHGEESIAKPIQIAPIEMAKLGVKPLEAEASNEP